MDYKPQSTGEQIRSSRQKKGRFNAFLFLLETTGEKGVGDVGTEAEDGLFEIVQGGGGREGRAEGVAAEAGERTAVVVFKQGFGRAETASLPAVIMQIFSAIDP